MSFDLEKALSTWRHYFQQRHGFLKEDLDELERHIRDHVAHAVRQGVSEENAFWEAVREVGDYEGAEEEYEKVYWKKLKRHHLLTTELGVKLAMWKHYLKIAWRNLLRQKGYSFINVAGLTIGMACCLIIFQYVAFEYSFDQFNAKKDRIYRATFEKTRNGEREDAATIGYAFGPAVAQDVPEIVQYARVHPNYGDAVLSYKSPAGDRTFTEEKVLYVDTAFLSLFDYPLIEGAPPQPLAAPHTMLISESMARKYFGDEDPVGKIMDFTGWVSGAYIVTGAFKDVPSTSHLQFDFLLPMADLLKSEQYEGDGSAWGGTNFITYLELQDKADVGSIERKITRSYIQHRPDGQTSGNREEVHLQPLPDIHLNAEIQAPATVTGDRKTVYFFMVIGLITLVIALVNYVNLTTARALERAKEVGVRKVVGAHRGQLMRQFLIESTLMNVVALMLAIGLTLVSLPVVNRLAAVDLTGALWRDVRFWAVFLSVFGLGVVLSGLYPAFMLSSFRPVTALKGNRGAFTSRMTLRKGLVVIQFAASIALLAGTTIVYAQLRYMRSMDTGLDLEQILVVEKPRIQPTGTGWTDAMNTARNEIRTIPAIQNVGLSNSIPGHGFNWRIPMYRATADPATGHWVGVAQIDAHFMDVYGLEMVAGEPFREGMIVPGGKDLPVLINESMAKALGFPSNEEATGQRISAGGGGMFLVQGVVKDFNWSSAHVKTEAVMFIYDSSGGNISMKVSTENLPGTIAAVRKTYEAIFPDNPFNYTFADAAFAEQYRNDERFAALFGIFAALAIFIACLGLFGLTSFTAARRTKEIGVRKVLGASVSSIVALLSVDFLTLVGIAFFVATPLAYFAMRHWLQDFAYRIAIGPGVFLLTGVLVLLIALATVSFQAIKAALADPVKSLRYE